MVDRNREGAEAEVAQKLPKQVEEAEAAAEECTSHLYLHHDRQLHGRASFSVQGSPNDQAAFSNCLIINPADFPEGQHVLVKQQFPMTTR